MQAGCADRAAARPEEGRSHHARKAARTMQAGSAGSAARAAAQREEGSSHHAGQAARTMQVGSAGSADRAAARRADPRSIHSPPPPPPHTFRTPRTHRRVRDKARLPVQGTAAFKMLVGVQVQAAQSRDLEQLAHTARSGVSSMFRQGHGEDGAAAGGPPPQSRAGATRGSSRPELQAGSLPQDEEEDEGWGDDWDRAQEAQNHRGRTRFKNAIFALPPAGASLENLREWRVVEPDVAGSVHISRQVQVWRMAGRVGPRSSTESQVNADLTRTLDRFSLAKAEGLLTGTSHSAIESYQATMEDWVLENYDHLYQSRVEGQEENDVVKYLSWLHECERVCKLSPEDDMEAILEHANKPIVPLPVTLCASLFSACMRPREKLSGPGGIAGLGRNPTDAEVRSNRAIGFPTLNTFDQV